MSQSIYRSEEVSRWSGPQERIDTPRAKLRVSQTYTSCALSPKSFSHNVSSEWSSPASSFKSPDQHMYIHTWGKDAHLLPLFTQAPRAPPCITCPAWVPCDLSIAAEYCFGSRLGSRGIFLYGRPHGRRSTVESIIAKDCESWAPDRSLCVSTGTAAVLLRSRTTRMLICLPRCQTNPQVGRAYTQHHLSCVTADRAD